MAQKREPGSSAKLGSENPKERQALAAKPEASPLVDLPSRASTVTPLLSDMLARVEGIARWGLNE